MEKREGINLDVFDKRSDLICSMKVLEYVTGISVIFVSVNLDSKNSLAVAGNDVDIVRKGFTIPKDSKLVVLVPRCGITVLPQYVGHFPLIASMYL